VIQIPPFGDSYAKKYSAISKRSYLPHGHLPLTEEEEVDLARHVVGLLHVHEVGEELLHSRYLAQVLQPVSVAIELLGWCLHELPILAKDLLRVSLDIPELPICLQRVLAGASHQPGASTADGLRGLALKLL